MLSFVYSDAKIYPGKVIVCLGDGPHKTRLTLDVEDAMALSGAIRAEVARMPQDRVGTPADLGCEVL